MLVEEPVEIADVRDPFGRGDPFALRESFETRDATQNEHGRISAIADAEGGIGESPKSEEFGVSHVLIDDPRFTERTFEQDRDGDQSGERKEGRKFS